MARSSVAPSFSDLVALVLGAPSFRLAVSWDDKSFNPTLGALLYKHGYEIKSIDLLERWPDAEVFIIELAK